MHITQNRSAANPLSWNMWETCSNMTNRVASFVQPLFETLSCVATPTLNASISIGKLATSKTCLTVSLVALSLTSGASTPSPTPMAPTQIPDFLINSYTNGNQNDPSTASFQDGSFVVTWHGEGVGDNLGIFGQRFFANGSAWGAEFQANTYTTGNQWFPSTATFPDGSFVVTWRGEGANDSLGTFGQRFFPNGSTWGGEFRANNYTNGLQQFPSTAVLSNNSFVVTWWGEGTSDSAGIFGQLFFANGSAWGPEFQVNNYTTGMQQFPSTAPFSDGSFVVTWWGEGLGDNQGIFGQQFFADGSKWEAEFRANNYTNGGQQELSTAAFSDGSFVVTWNGEGTGGNQGVYGQRFFANSSTWGTEFRANNYTNGDQKEQSTITFSDGSFVVIWEGEGASDSFGIFGQRFFSNTTPWGPEFRVNDLTIGIQREPSAAAFSDDSFLVTWEGEETPGSFVYNVYGKRYDRFGQPIAWESTPFSPSSSTQSNPIPISPSPIPISPSGSTQFNPVPPPGLISSQMMLETSMSIRNTFPSTATSFSTPVSIQPTPNPSTRALVSTDTSSSSQMTPGSSTRMDNTIPFITTLVYSEPYPITLNGQSIGTFSFSGGTGQFASNNPNALNIEFDSDYVIEDGLTLTLFAVPDGEELTFENLSLTSSNSECFTAEGEWISSTANQDESEYQLLFSFPTVTCTLFTEASKVTVIPTLLGLV